MEQFNLCYGDEDLTHSREHELSDSELEKVRQVYVPINSIEELVKHRATHFCSYTINPNYIEPKKMQCFMYRFNLLTDVGMRMFEIDDINKHQIELIKESPIDFNKLEEFKNKYITIEVQKKFLETHKERLSSDRFYELLNEDGRKEIEDTNEEQISYNEDEEEFE